MGDDDRPVGMDSPTLLLMIMYRAVPALLLLLGIAAIGSKRAVSTRAVIGCSLAIVSALTIATALIEASWMRVSRELLARFCGADALLYGIPGLAVTIGVILLKRDRHQTWLRIGVLVALYLVAAHVGLRLSSHVADFVSAVG